MSRSSDQHPQSHSHEPENVDLKQRLIGESDEKSNRPHSFASDIHTSHSQPGGMSNVEGNEEYALQTYPTRVSGSSTSGVRHPSMADPTLADFPIVPAPLGPPMSSGGVIKLAHYFPLPPELEQESLITAAKEEEEEESQQRRKRLAVWSFFSIEILALLGLVCGINLTMLATSLPKIASDLYLSTASAFSIPSSYMLSCALGQPFFATLSSGLGRKPLLLISLVFLDYGSMAPILNKSFTLLLLSRCLSGLGSGGCYILGQHIFSELVGANHPWGCEWSFTVLFWLGAALGPIIGATNGFDITVCVCSFALMTLPFLLPQMPPEGSSWKLLPGVPFSLWALLYACAMSILIAINTASEVLTRLGWQMWIFFLFAIVSFVSISGLTRLYCDASTRIGAFEHVKATAASFVYGMLFAAAVYMTPFYFFLASELSPADAGLELAPWTMSLTIAVLAVEIALARTRYCLLERFGWRLTTVGWALATTGFGLMVLLNGTNVRLLGIPLGILVGLALGILSRSLSVTDGSSTSSGEESSSPTAVHIFFSTLGQAFGIAISSCILVSQLHSDIDTRLYNQPNVTFYSQDALAFVSAIQLSLREHHDIPTLISENYVGALSGIWVTMCIIAGVTFVLSALANGGRRWRSTSFSKP